MFERNRQLQQSYRHAQNPADRIYISQRMSVLIRATGQAYVFNKSQMSLTVTSPKPTNYTINLRFSFSAKVI